MKKCGFFRAECKIPPRGGVFRSEGQKARIRKEETAMTEVELRQLTAELLRKIDDLT